MKRVSYWQVCLSNFVFTAFNSGDNSTMNEQQTSTKLPPSKKHCCYNCHFLCLWNRVPGNDNLETCFDSVPSEKREIFFLNPKKNDKIKKGIDDKTGWHLRCRKEVWDSANFQSDQEKNIPKNLSMNRGDTCFFYKYIPGICFPAAYELKRRESDRREAEENRKLTRKNAMTAQKTAWAAIIVALLSVGVTITNIVWTKVIPISVENELVVKQPIKADALTGDIVNIGADDHEYDGGEPETGFPPARE